VSSSAGLTGTGATIGEALAGARRRLADAGVESPALDARLLLQHALAIDAATVIGYPERRMDADEGERFDDLVARRCRREPLAYITGRREFWSLPFAVTADTLVPRPDSETLVEAVLDRYADRGAPLSVLDLGTGTGCLLLAILSEYPIARGSGVDISAGAVAVARANADYLDLGDRAEFSLGNWAVGLSEFFDIVVANLPYVPANDRETLAPEVAEHEPEGAVFGGADGLDPFRLVIPDLSRLLAIGGVAFLEIGAGQLDAITALVQNNGLQIIEIKEDLSGHPRCVAVTTQAAARP